MTVQEIIKAIDDYIGKCGCHYYKDLYIGITNEPERRLFEEHRVDKEHDFWLYAQCDSEDVSREVEAHYLDLGMRGGKGGGAGDGSSQYVYCYVVTPNTIE